MDRKIFNEFSINIARPRHGNRDIVDWFFLAHSKLFAQCMSHEIVDNSDALRRVTTRKRSPLFIKRFE